MSKVVFNAVIDRLDKETGYGYNALVEMYNDAVDHGVEATDFVDAVLDSTIFLKKKENDYVQNSNCNRYAERLY